MLALYPDQATAESLVVPGGLPVSDLHITIAYCGDSSAVDLTALTSAAGALLDREPVQAMISGHGRFTGGDLDVIVALIDSPALDDLRSDAVAALGSAGIEIPHEHGYTAHCTLRYQDPEDADPVWRLPPRPVTFTAVAVVHGKQRTDLPFRLAETTHPIAPYAREAYMAGWAASGGPFTPRVLAGCHAAAHWAAEHADQADVFEVALKLGSLEGSWAVVYRRRSDLIRDKTAAVTDLWRNLIHGLNARSLVSKYRAIAGLHGETAGPNRATRKKEAVAAATAWLYAILDDPRYPALTAAVAEAIQSGLAEGDVGARLVAAEDAGITAGQLDTQLMFQTAYEAMGKLPSLPGMGDEWVHKIIGGAGNDLGRVLSGLLEDSASYEDMLEAAVQTVGGTDVRAVSSLLDFAISGAYSQGALKLYSSEGTSLVDWLTAGDGRVCAECDSNADDGPYPPDQFPSCPDHPLCRCTPAPVDQLPATVFTPFLSGGD